MTTKRETDYWAASARSFQNQKGGITVPPEVLEKGIVEINIGFQPLGISSQVVDGKDQVAIAAYYEPAVCLAEVIRDDGGLHFNGTWVRGAEGTIRMFPDICMPAGANRCQTANFTPNGSLMVSRNSEGVLYRLKPPMEAGKRWTAHGTVELTENPLHSLLVTDTAMHAVESDPRIENWWYGHYTNVGLLSSTTKIPAFMYGVARYRDEIYFITDFRADVPRGIYRLVGTELKLVVPEVWGTGIAFLSDGSALVSRYGQGHPGFFNGIPGALVYVHAASFGG